MRRLFDGVNRKYVDDFGVWRSLVSRLVRDQEAMGSSPVTPTTPAVSMSRTAGFSFSQRDARDQTASFLLPLDISSVLNQPESWDEDTRFLFTYILHLLVCMSRHYPALFVMPVKHSGHTPRRRLFGFPHGNCAALQDLAVPDTQQTCSESLSVACGSCQYP